MSAINGNGSALVEVQDLRSRHEEERQEHDNRINIVWQQLDELKKQQEELLARRARELARLEWIQFQNPASEPYKSLFLSSNDYQDILDKRITIENFMAEVGYIYYLKKIGIPLGAIAVAGVAVPVLIGGANRPAEIATFWKKVVQKALDPTPYPVSYLDENKNLIIASSSNLDKTLTLTAFGVLLSLPYALIDARIYVDKIKSDYDKTKSIKKLLFFEYYTWKVRKIKQIAQEHLIPTKFENDPNLASYKCTLTNKLFIFPFRTPQNKVFEHHAIEEYLLTHCTCPVTNLSLCSEQLIFAADIYDKIRTHIYAENIRS